MPVRVVLIGDEQRVTARYALEHSLPGPFRCGECNGAVFLKPCHVIAPHFAHKSETVRVGCGESSTHAEAKVEFALCLRKWRVQQHCEHCAAETLVQFTSESLQALCERSVECEE
jgi:competence CoiA-like predicted nuclease